MLGKSLSPQQDAGEGRPPAMEGSRECIEYATADSRQREVRQLGS
jgi:hypothetical protein